MKFLIFLPIFILILSVVLAIRDVKKGIAPKKALFAQILTFAIVCLICISAPIIVSAAKSDAIPTTETTAVETESATTDSNQLKGAESPWGFGLGLLAVAIVTSCSCIGAGKAVAASAPAAIAATSENPGVFGKFLVIVALAEGIALYGVVISFMILTKI